MGIRKFFESRKEPGRKLSVDEYYGWIFENSVPGLPEKARLEGLTPLEYMRRYGAFEVSRNVGAQHEAVVPEAELAGRPRLPRGRVYTRAPTPASPNVVPVPSPDPDADGRRPVGIEVDGVVRRGFPTPSGKLEFYSSTLEAWGWREYALPDLHPEPRPPRRTSRPARCRSSRPSACPCRSTRAARTPSGSTRSPTRTRCGSTRQTPAKLGVETGDLVRVETRIGHFVVKAWVTEGIRPGVVACSHHMGRWKRRGPRPAADDGDGEPRARGHLVDAPPREGRPSLRLRRRRHRRASGGRTPVCTRTSPSRCSPTRSPACTAGTRPSG